MRFLLTTLFGICFFGAFTTTAQNQFLSQVEQEIQEEKERVLKLKEKTVFSLEELLMGYRNISMEHIDTALLAEEAKNEGDYTKSQRIFNLNLSTELGMKRHFSHSSWDDLSSSKLEAEYYPFAHNDVEPTASVNHARTYFETARKLDQLLPNQEKIVSEFADLYVRRRDLAFKKSYLKDLQAALYIYKKAKRYVVSNIDDIAFMENIIQRLKLSIQDDIAIIDFRKSNIVRVGNIAFPTEIDIQEITFDFNSFNINAFENWSEKNSRFGLKKLKWYAEKAYQSFDQIIDTEFKKWIPNVSLFARAQKEESINNVFSKKGLDFFGGVRLDIELANSYRDTYRYKRAALLKRKSRILLKKINSLSERYRLGLSHTVRTSLKGIKDYQKDKKIREKQYKKLFRTVRVNFKSWNVFSGFTFERERANYLLHRMEGRFLHAYYTYKYVLMQN